MKKIILPALFLTFYFFGSTQTVNDVLISDIESEYMGIVGTTDFSVTK